MRMTDAINRFSIFLEANGRSPRTIDGYRRDLELLIAFTGNVDLADFTSDRVHAFLISGPVRLRKDGKPRAPVTVNRTKAAVKSFGRYLIQSGLVEHDPTGAIEIRRANRNSPQAFTEPERKRLLRELASRTGTAAVRDRVMASVMLATGLRLSELVGLDIADLDFETKHISIKAKGGRRETRFINSNLRRLLRKYLRIRSDMPTHSTALFLSNRLSRISTRQVQTRFKQWLAWSGIDRAGLTVHSLRHTFGTRLYRKTKDLILVGKAMGHKTIEATRVYVHTTDDALEDALELL